MAAISEGDSVMKNDTDILSVVDSVIRESENLSLKVKVDRLIESAAPQINFDRGSLYFQLVDEFNCEPEPEPELFCNNGCDCSESHILKVDLFFPLFNGSKANNIGAYEYEQEMGITSRLRCSYSHDFLWSIRV